MKSLRTFLISRPQALLFIGALLFLAAFGLNTAQSSAQLKADEKSDSPVSPFTARTFRVVSTTAAPGDQVFISVELDSNGDEVATSFALNFDPTKLSAPAVSLGTDVPPGTALTVNANQAANGIVGILVDSGNSFSLSGPPRQVVKFRFNVAANASGSTPVTFYCPSPRPPGVTPCSTSDPVGNLLTAAYTDGVLTIQPAQPSFVTISGRITTPTGQGLRNATVYLQDSQNVRRTTTTSSFGFYQFDNVPTGGPYTVGVISRSYRYQPTVLSSVSADLSNVDLVGQE